MQTMKVINPEAFIKAFECTEKREFGELSAEHFEIPYSDIKPIEGYEPEPNFPFCDNFHKSLFDYAVKWFEEFPRCCPGHRKLLGAEWFKKENYKTMPNKVLTQLSYTEYHISKQINNADWFKDITDYIDYNFQSFGQLPLGYGTPVGVTHYGNALIEVLKNAKEEIVSKEKQQKLIEYLESFYNQRSTHNENPKTDLNILLGIYQKWLKIFPFEMSFFAHLKPYFERQLPFIEGEPMLNPYTGLAKAKLHTKGSLINFLLNATNYILTTINSHSLYKQGLLTEPQKIKLELVLSERIAKLKHGYINKSQDEDLRFRRILKEWFADEKHFIDEIVPFLKTLPPQQEKTKTEMLKAELDKYGFFSLAMMKPLSEPNKEKLVEMISVKGLPYSIAMFDYLGFLKYLEKEHFQTKYKLEKEIAKWFNSDAEGRAVKGNMSSLLKNTTENKNRYTAHIHIETVKKDYQKLK